jgi:thiol:disulfide interchange protein DsbA
MLRRLFVLALLLLPWFANAQALPAPRLGVDYFVLADVQPTYRNGKIEVAEVFSYACVHCAHFQPKVDAWLQQQAKAGRLKDLRWEYVPAVFGGVWNNFAKAYLVAEKTGVVKRTHNAVFKAIHEERALQTGSLEEIADLYARFGVDRNNFLAALNEPLLNDQLKLARDFALRGGVEGTPTLIVAGKYRVVTTRDRGFDGMLATLDFLLAQERAAARKATQGKAGKSNPGH